MLCASVSIPVKKEWTNLPTTSSPQPVHSESGSAPITSSSLSETATTNECVSEGQWLVSGLSDGEIADMESNECKYDVSE